MSTTTLRDCRPRRHLRPWVNDAAAVLLTAALVASAWATQGAVLGVYCAAVGLAGYWLGQRERPHGGAVTAERLRMAGGENG